ncbi:DNA-3-methyladenine glycosylase II OS=Streptomyces microflavus OX=1919 GN=HUT09_29805 PE=4 SV=1 [Streptomyces microflavus]
MTFYPSAAACQQAGFRACKRCRPDAGPNPPVERPRRLRGPRHAAHPGRCRGPRGRPGLAYRLGYSARQIERQLLAELGAGPLALARAQRRTARLLIETTTLPLAEVAFAAGFSSVRTFNETVREVSPWPPANCAPAPPAAPWPPPPPA